MSNQIVSLGIKDFENICLVSIIINVSTYISYSAINNVATYNYFVATIVLDHPPLTCT